MQKKNFNLNTGGFTIVETLIVLAVSSFLFAIISVSIAGQVQRYRHRDSMYRVQQSIQNVINDVQTGRFINTGGKKANEILIGKKILFCKTTSTTHCISTLDNGDTPNANQFKVNTTAFAENRAGDSASRVQTQLLDLPNNLEFIGVLNSTGSVYSGGSEFGFDIRFTKPSSNDSKNEINIFNYDSYPRSSNTQLETYKICFKGNQYGSLEIGGIDPGLNVRMNIQDNACKARFP